jgi:hypothetical protein
MIGAKLVNQSTQKDIYNLSAQPQVCRDFMFRYRLKSHLYTTVRDGPMSHYVLYSQEYHNGSFTQKSYARYSTAYCIYKGLCFEILVVNRATNNRVSFDSSRLLIRFGGATATSDIL